MFTGQTPDITPAQVAGVLVFVGGQAVAFGWMSQHTEQLAVSLGATVIAAALKFSDAYLRGQRATAVLTPSTTSPKQPNGPGA